VVPSLREQQALVGSLRQRSAIVLRHLLDREEQSLRNRRQRSRAVLVSRLAAARSDIEHLGARARALSPAATLDRGYAIVTLAGGAIARSADQIAEGDVLGIRLAEGTVAARAVAAEQGN
jgi:exodeoxyribonuclease VII large subunit